MRTRTSRSVSAVVGSSMMMSRASEASARQMATSCLCATDRVSTRASRGMSTPTRSSMRAASSRIRRRSTSRRPALSSALSAMFSATPRFGKSEKSWKITMIPAAADWRGVRRAKLSPATVMRAASGSSTPARILMSVDFPLPFSPASDTASPSRIAKPTPSRARIPA